MTLKSLPPEEIQAALDRSLRFALEVVTFLKVSYVLGEPPPNLGTEALAALEVSIQTMNAAVKLGYSPNATIYAEVERDMHDEAWRVAWIERTRTPLNKH